MPRLGRYAYIGKNWGVPEALVIWRVMERLDLGFSRIHMLAVY